MFARTIIRAAPRSVQKRCLSSTPRVLQAVPREEHAAHTASQRIRSWMKSLPVETYPLFVVMGCSLGFGVYSFILPAFKDGTLRLRRSSARNHH